MKTAAIRWDDTKAYFFRDDSYIRYNVVERRADDGYPRSIASNWPGLFAKDIDAAVAWSNGKAYFFKGSEYIRVDLETKKADPGYPKPIAGSWPGLFTKDIDAAVAWTNGKVYFFKGSEYIRVDLVTKKADPGYPKPIAGNWPGLFSQNISAAMAWTNGKAYFFRDSASPQPDYIRVDLVTKAADANYPRPVAGNWPGLHGGDFGAPQVRVNYRQLANFYTFFSSPNSSYGADQGMFVLYRLDNAVNDADLLTSGSVNSGENFTVELSRIAAAHFDERSGNTSLDSWIFTGPKQIVCPPSGVITPMNTRIVIRVGGDPQALKAARIPLHYYGTSGWKVGMVGNDSAIPFVDHMTPEKAQAL